MEQHKATVELAVFFEKLLKLKAFVKAQLNVEGNSPVLESIYEQLDTIIKEEC